MGRDASYGVLAAAFVLTSAATVALLVGCARTVAQARLELQGRLAPGGGAPARPHSLAHGQALPPGVVAAFGDPGSPSLVAVLSGGCPSCLELAEELAEVRPVRLDVALLGDGHGEVRALVERAGHVLGPEASAALAEAAGVRATPVLFARDGDGTVAWLPPGRPTRGWAELGAGIVNGTFERQAVR